VAAEIKAIISDVDGNLIMTEEACWRLENEIFRQMNIPPMSREIHQQSWGVKLGEAVSIRSGGVADVEQFWQLFPENYANFVEKGWLDAVEPENIVALKQIRAMQLEHYVLTSRTLAEMGHLMGDKSPLRSLIDAFYYQENMEFHKPDPRAFDHIERLHGLKPENCVYVGDQPGDAAAANGAGLRFIANLEEGLRTEEDFDGYAVDAFILKYSDLPAVLAELYGL
jgi:HAD superfamily hydrolase (TIGR01509 family)